MRLKRSGSIRHCPILKNASSYGSSSKQPEWWNEMFKPESQASSKPQPAPVSAGGLATFAEALEAASSKRPATDGAPPAADGAPPVEAADGDSEPQKPAKKAKPKDLAEAASQLGVKDADLYALLVPSKRDGAEPYTIGKLKDLAEEHDDFVIARLDHEQKTREQQSQYLRAMQELADIFSTLPPEAVKPEAREKLRATRENAMTRERQLVLDSIPEWKDQSVRTQELEAMEEHLRDAGYPAGYLGGIYDHRTLRYIRSNMLRERAIADALEKVKERKPTTPPKSNAKAAPNPGKRQATAAPSRESRAYAQFGDHIFQASKSR